MGWDTKRFGRSLSREFICSICQEVFANPVQRPSCEHLYCRECILTWLQEQEKCPECRLPLTPSDLNEAPKIFKSLLGQLEVSCDFASSGCKDIITLERLEYHCKECGFNPINIRLKEEAIVKAIRSASVVEEVDLDPDHVSDKHKQAIFKLKKIGHISEKVFQAMILVDFRHFEKNLPQGSIKESLLFVGKRLEKWSVIVKRGCNLLDASNHWGSCYIGVCLALMVGSRGSVVTFTCYQQDVDGINKCFGWLLSSGRLRVIVEPDHEKWRRGYPRNIPYELIFIYFDDVDKVKEQLKTGGKLLCDHYKGKVFRKNSNGALA